MTESKIEWCDRSDWNPLRGCTRVSPGCGGPGRQCGCYAEAIAARFSDSGQPFHGFAERTKSGPRWTGKIELIEERLSAPLGWRKPGRIFALSMSDLFHESVPEEWIDRIFAVMALCPQHTFQVLTKRAERMWRYIGDFETPENVERAMDLRGSWSNWPLPNVWLGVSVEDQRRADERIPVLLETPAAVRWVSAEPLLGPVDLSACLLSVRGREGQRVPLPMFDSEEGRSPRRGYLGNAIGLDWVVCGGESGPGARPLNTEWIRGITAQCKAAGVSCFVKQLGAKPYDGQELCTQLVWLDLSDRKGADPTEWPEDLRVREYPKQGEVR